MHVFLFSYLNWIVVGFSCAITDFYMDLTLDLKRVYKYKCLCNLG